VREERAIREYEGGERKREENERKGLFGLFISLTDLMHVPLILI